jgi:hypothetical protein
LVEAPHAATAQAWAEACGLTYKAVVREDDWADALNLLCSGGDNAIIVEAFTDSEQDAEILRKFYKEH